MPKGTDVIVIGAGITGTAIAYYLSEHGVDIEVLDAGAIGAQASTQTAGNLHFQLSYHAMKGSEEEFRQHTSILEMNDDSERRWNELSSEFGDSIEVTRRGGIVVAECTRDLEALQRKVELEQAAGFRTVFLAGDELRERVPELDERVLGGSWHDAEGHVNARLVCYELARVAAIRGARFHTSTPVTALNRDKQFWRVQTSGGETRWAHSVVIAAGAWTHRVAAMAGVAIPLDIHGLNMSITEKCSQRMTNLVMHASRPLSIKQMAHGNIMIGGGRPASIRTNTTPLGLSADPQLRSVVSGIDDAARVVPRARDLAVIRSWQGLLATPVDELPIVGAIDDAPGLYVSVAGHTGYTLGPSCGRAIADLIVGRTPEVSLTPFTPGRFS